MREGLEDNIEEWHMTVDAKEPLLRYCGEDRWQEYINILPVCGYPDYQYKAGEETVVNMFFPQDQNENHKESFQFKWEPAYGLSILSESWFQLVLQMADAGIVNVEPYLTEDGEVCIDIADGFTYQVEEGGCR